MSTCQVIGIDLGTTYSCVGVYKNGIIEVIANGDGHRTTPSEVAFTAEQRLVGDAAKAQGHNNPKNTINNVKRLIGRKYYDPEVQKDIQNLQYDVRNKDSRPIIEVEYKGERQQFTPEQISAAVLQNLKEVAEKYLGNKVTDAVITVPAYFNDSQRQATKDAATIAGLNAIRIINEPTAAAMAYGLDNHIKGERNVFVFDLGGGTFDVSIVKISEGPVFEVKATTGDTHLGGIDFDQRLLFHFAAEFKAKHGLDVIQDSKAVKKLLKACEKVKLRLSKAYEASIEIDSLMNRKDFHSKMRRARFETLCEDLFEKTLEKTKKALSDAKLDKSDIDCVVLVGGSTRIPKIKKIVQEFFDGKEPEQTINPDEAVAYGAAVQAAALSGLRDSRIKNVRLHDVIPLSIGLKTGPNDVMSIVIKRNTHVPTTFSESFTNNGDDQTSVVFDIYEGERALAKDNNKLGEFTLDNLPRAPAGTLFFDVKFNIDESGILSVSATERSTGKHNSVIMKNERGRLPKSEIDRMVEEAKRFEEEDRAERERNDAKAALESYVYSVKDSLKNSSRMTVDEAQNARSAWIDVNTWLEASPNADKNQLVSKFEKLKNVCDPILRRMRR